MDRGLVIFPAISRSPKSISFRLLELDQLFSWRSIFIFLPVDLTEMTVNVLNEWGNPFLDSAINAKKRFRRIGIDFLWFFFSLWGIDLILVVHVVKSDKSCKNYDKNSWRSLKEPNRETSFIQHSATFFFLETIQSEDRHLLIYDGVACWLCAKRWVRRCAWRVRENSSTTQLTMFQQQPGFTIRRYQFSVRFAWVRIRSRGAFIRNRRSFSYSALLFFFLFFSTFQFHIRILVFGVFFFRWIWVRVFGYVFYNDNKYIKRNFEIDEYLWLRTVLYAFFLEFIWCPSS